MTENCFGDDVEGNPITTRTGGRVASQVVLPYLHVGGRYRANMTADEEHSFLSSFLEKAARGEILMVGEVKRAYEKAVEHAVPKSTIYRMLARHGWRKITPRPHHPKADVLLQEEFKINSPKQ